MIVEYAENINELCEVFERAAQAGAEEIRGELIDGVYRIEYDTKGEKDDN
jgi:hypothetical protein